MRLNRRSSTPSDQQQQSLAEDLEQRVGVARDAERAYLALRDEERPEPEVRAALRRLEDALTDAVAAADAVYRLEVGPVGQRVRYLARLRRPEVQAADTRRRQLALALSHYRMVERDDRGMVRPAAVPPSVGTAPRTLATGSAH